LHENDHDDHGDDVLLFPHHDDDDDHGHDHDCDYDHDRDPDDDDHHALFRAF